MSRHALRIIAALLWALSPMPARAAHPLITEDTGTQGQNNFQLEFTSEHTTLREDGANQRMKLTTTALSYGVLDSVDITSQYRICISVSRWQAVRPARMA